MWYAAANGNAPLVDKLLAAGAKFNRLDKKLDAPLQAACWKGHVLCAEALLRAHADVNGEYGGNTYATPLMYACHCGQAECVQLLQACRRPGGPNCVALLKVHEENEQFLYCGPAQGLTREHKQKAATKLEKKVEKLEERNLEEEKKLEEERRQRVAKRLGATSPDRIQALRLQYALRRGHDHNRGLRQCLRRHPYLHSYLRHCIQAAS